MIMMQQHMLLDHCLDRMSAKMACLFSLIVYLSRISVIEIGSNKMLTDMLVSIRRVSIPVTAIPAERAFFDELLPTGNSQLFPGPPESLQPDRFSCCPHDQSLFV